MEMPSREPLRRPPCLRRAEVRERRVYAVALVLFFLPHVWILTRTRGRPDLMQWAIVFLMITMVPLVIVLFARLTGRHRAWSRRVELAGGLLCPECGYDLHATPSFAAATHPSAAGTTAVCPECGATLNPEEVKELWRACFPGMGGGGGWGGTAE